VVAKNVREELKIWFELALRTGVSFPGLKLRQNWKIVREGIAQGLKAPLFSRLTARLKVVP
jgi:hypothetical protein